eukprot:741309-Hanusia_phi.AAC.1
MSDPQHLFSKAGLRSLSPRSPEGGPDSMYGTQEDYWRGKVWININFLALKALKHYGQSWKEGAELYTQLRQAIIENMLGQYTKKVIGRRKEEEEEGGRTVGLGVDKDGRDTSSSSTTTRAGRG